ncbi:uncharacterized protein EV422DRAFT_287511 [Fimicolochytrium jonesii]|uniref:uncharacterized protein n=1 Tax=Fimicolochytrium jonesii TaxID=1396493 RepID=UPI0022FF16ED|nr:uncharacterized protein EV422DRAFT_287511 [Fimicolochytrium jonesii]KAI8816523.1 hypothetical protein EV422DRAFT_287511 [Fimicolochytrium jonesii]
MIIADMMAFAIDNPAPAVVVLISGDGDFSYALSLLNGRQYTIVLCVNIDSAPVVLTSAASHVLNWRLDALSLTAGPTEVKAVTSVADTGSGSAASTPSRSRTALLRPSEFPTVPASSPPTPATSSGTDTPPASLIKLPTSATTITTPTSSTSTTTKRIPEQYLDLITVLRARAREGQNKPLRSQVGVALTLCNPMLYQRALGPANFAQYSKEAEALGLVVLGGESGTAWIALGADYAL